VSSLRSDKSHGVHAGKLPARISIQNQHWRPTPRGRDILVAVQAVAVNPVDTKVRSTKDKIETSPCVIGWDASGVVADGGPDVTLFKVGDEVYYAGDITRPGTNAEF
jgi:NADPH:quinone reductase